MLAHNVEHVGAEQADQHRLFGGAGRGDARPRGGQSGLAEEVASLQHRQFQLVTVFVAGVDFHLPGADGIHPGTDIPLFEDDLFLFVMPLVNDALQKGQIPFFHFAEDDDRAEKVGQGLFIPGTPENIAPEWIHAVPSFG